MVSKSETRPSPEHELFAFLFAEDLPPLFKMLGFCRFLINYDDLDRTVYFLSNARIYAHVYNVI